MIKCKCCDNELLNNIYGEMCEDCYVDARNPFESIAINLGLKEDKEN